MSNLKGKIKLIPLSKSGEGIIVACKQFQDSYRAYRIVKAWNLGYSDIEAITLNEFKTYTKINSTPLSELFQVVVEYVKPIERSEQHLKNYRFAIESLAKNNSPLVFDTVDATI